jgi:hypothetical protein
MEQLIVTLPALVLEGAAIPWAEKPRATSRTPGLQWQTLRSEILAMLAWRSTRTESMSTPEDRKVHRNRRSAAVSTGRGVGADDGRPLLLRKVPSASSSPGGLGYGP